MAAAGPGVNYPVNVIGQIIRLECIYYFTARIQLGVWTHHYRVMQVTGTGTTLGQVATAMDAVYGPLVKPLSTDQCTYRGCQVRVIFPDVPSTPAHDTVNQGAGTVVGEALPSQVSGLIGTLTRFGGQRYRGRKYIPFPGEGDNTVQGAPTGTYPTRLQTLADAMVLTRLVGGADNVTLQPILWHDDRSNYTDIIQAIGRSAWATMRKRGMYGRSNAMPF